MFWPDFAYLFSILYWVNSISAGKILPSLTAITHRVASRVPCSFNQQTQHKPICSIPALCKAYCQQAMLQNAPDTCICLQKGRSRYDFCLSTSIALFQPVLNPVECFLGFILHSLACSTPPTSAVILQFIASEPFLQQACDPDPGNWLSAVNPVYHFRIHGIKE